MDSQQIYSNYSSIPLVPLGSRKSSYTGTVLSCVLLPAAVWTDMMTSASCSVLLLASFCVSPLFWFGFNLEKRCADKIEKRWFATWMSHGSIPNVGYFCLDKIKPRLTLLLFDLSSLSLFCLFPPPKTKGHVYHWVRMYVLRYLQTSLYSRAQ